MEDDLNSETMGKKSELTHNKGHWDSRGYLFLVLWYIFSAITLLLNKYILTYQKADPQILCGAQMLIVMWCGLFHMYFPLGTYSSKIPSQKKPPDFLKKMVILGSLQLGIVIFSLVALSYVAVSFAETIKSSAPIFTLLIARFILGEKTNFFVILSLFPVMLGLALCSSNELSFSFAGFVCALITNLCECFQNVVSKSLFTNKSYVYNPAELQFYPNLVAVLFQIPLWILLFDFDGLKLLQDTNILLTILISGISFHGQTITAYVVITYISPVTYSVANTTKRALLIWLSILFFDNPVTFFSGLGTFVVFVGVFLYNKAREIDARKRDQFSIDPDKIDDYR